MSVLRSHQPAAKSEHCTATPAALIMLGKAPLAFVLTSKSDPYAAERQAVCLCVPHAEDAALQLFYLHNAVKANQPIQTADRKKAATPWQD